MFEGLEKKAASKMAEKEDGDASEKKDERYKEMGEEILASIKEGNAEALGKKLRAFVKVCGAAE